MIEATIINNLLLDEEYCRKVIPFVKPEYFTSVGNRVLFDIINDYIDQYDALPTAAALNIECDKKKDISADTFKEVTDFITNLNADEQDFDWIVDTTECLRTIKKKARSRSVAGVL